MTFFEEFDQMLGDLEDVEGRLMKKLQSQLDEILKAVKNGEMEGSFETRTIDEPGMKGYIIQGRFGTKGALEPFEPIKPLRRRTLPENPFELAKKALNEIREPLTDVFEENDSVKIFAELPGENESDIRLKIAGGNLEIKGKHFHKIVNLPGNAATGNMHSEYKNGVLKITVPKENTQHSGHEGKTRMV